MSQIASISTAGVYERSCYAYRDAEDGLERVRCSYGVYAVNGTVTYYHSFAGDHYDATLLCDRVLAAGRINLDLWEVADEGETTEERAEAAWVLEQDDRMAHGCYA